MSDVFRKSVMSRLPRLPPTRAPWADEPEHSNEDQAEELEELEEGDGLGDLNTNFSSSSNQQDFSPISASSYFSTALEVDPPGNDTTFRVYLTPPTTTASTSGSDTKGKNKETILVCHHGAGASGLSFATLANNVVSKSGGELGIMAFDCRGHVTLIDDFIGVVSHLYPNPQDAPSLVLLGHSMGAAPIISAAPILQHKGYTIPGVIVLDVVEGTAIDALPIMKTILSNRPTTYQSVIDGIHWHVTSNSIRNSESARVSVPSFLIPDPTSFEPSPTSRQIWRTDLLATEPYWTEWYAGLSQRFLSAKCARLLVLAGQERLDKDLMVGQMQGKFQLEVMQDVGHYLHEDDPVSLASTIVAFWRRNTRVLVLPPKIGSTNSGSIAVKQVGQQ